MEKTCKTCPWYLELGSNPQPYCAMRHDYLKNTDGCNDWKEKPDDKKEAKKRR